MDKQEEAKNILSEKHGLPFYRDDPWFREMALEGKKRQIMPMIQNGITGKECAKILKINIKTVYSYIKNYSRLKSVLANPNAQPS